MLDIDKMYSEYPWKYLSPDFSVIVKKCNGWLADHNYAPVTEKDVKDKLKYHDGEFFAFPYGRIYHIISNLVQSKDKDNFEENFKTEISMIDYVPEDHGIKAGEEGVEYEISKISNILHAPNDYALTNKMKKEL